MCNYCNVEVCEVCEGGMDGLVVVVVVGEVINTRYPAVAEAREILPLFPFPLPRAMERK